MISNQNRLNNHKANFNGWKLALFAVILLSLMFLSLIMGRYHMDTEKIIQVLQSRITGNESPDLKIAAHIIWQVRLPRVLLAALIGAGLAIAGASLQGLFQNPLVSPDLLGVCSGSGCGAALGILFTSGTGLVTTGLAFGFGLISVALTLSMVRIKGQSQTMSYILSGIIVTSVFTALTSLIKYVADPGDQLPAITFWLMGSFANSSFADLRMVLLPILLGISGLLILKWRINLLSLGDEEAFSLGINPKTTRIAVILLTTTITAASVMVSGIIGWVGLVIPHISRRLVGVNHEQLLPASCLLGAGFMVLVDSAARYLTAAEIPIGILTALIGAPFFGLVYSRMKGES
jgi:iron complex transport system permease protein